MKEECVTDFEKWIYVLKHMETLERIPFATQKKIFKRLAEVADSSCLSKEEKEKYEESQNAVDNYNLGIFTAWQDGEQKGLAKGELSKSLSIARNMLMEGMPDVLVLKMTGLTQAQLDSLKK